MIFGRIFGGSAKTYEMPAGAVCSLDSLRDIVGMPHMDLRLKYFDIAVKVGDQSHPYEYRLKHNFNSIVGGNIEFRVPQDEEHIGQVIDALTGLIDKDKSDDKKSEIDRINSGGRTIVTIKPHERIALPELVTLLNGYHDRNLREPKVVGYRLENLPGNEYKTVTGAGLPLQEVKSK
jgi:hypothetical protein